MKAHGVDYGRWTEWRRPEVSPKPIDFIIAGLSSGDYTPPRVEINMPYIRKEPVAMGYHFYESQINWTKQVGLFLRNAERAKVKALWWDYESNERNRFYERTANETMEAIKWLRERFDGIVGLYSNLNDYYVNILPFPVAPFFEDVPWWVAYPDNDPDDINHPWYEKIGRTHSFYQYSWSGHGPDYGVYNYPDKKAIDLNVFEGSKSLMHIFLGIIDEPPPPPPQPDCTPEYNQAIETYKDKIIEVGEALKR
jgi:GH25 family lysozyme M1 (1,4-beta-N-acetylmuramidase)